MAIKISLNPRRIAKYHHTEREFIRTLGTLPRTQVANNAKHKTALSKKATKRMRNAVNWLTYLSAPRHVRTNSKKVIPNFQISFVTLTLPVKQLHEHKEVKSKCLNYFFTVARAKWNIKNYIWKAELQANGNIHFHVTFDKYVHWQAIRREWNNAIELLGYVSRYQALFAPMDFETYHFWRCQQGSQNRQANYKAFTFGTSTNWMSPNTTDVKKVRDVNNLASYLSKYIAKPIADENATGPIADSALSMVGRLWYCSQSLSGMKSLLFDYTSEIVRFYNEMKNLKGSFFLAGEWFELIFFNHLKVPPDVREFIRQELVSFAMESGYPFPHSSLHAGKRNVAKKAIHFSAY